MEPHDHADDQRVELRFRLRRGLLWALVGSLGAGALIATGVVLLGRFNDLTVRILVTLVSLALHAGLAMLFAAMLERRLWPTLSRVALVLLAADFLVFAGVWWSTTREAAWGRAALVFLILVGTCLVAIPPAALRQRGRYRGLSGAVLLLCAVELAWSVLAIWADYFAGNMYMLIGRPAAILGTAACAGSWTCLLLLGEAPPPATIIRNVTIACIALLAIAVSACIWVDDMTEPAARVVGALGILGVCGSVALPVLGRLHKVHRVVHMETTRRTVELRCPRCGRACSLEVGDSKCPTCNLRFHIEIQEPRCARCGYLLWQLTERRCPECGEPF